MIRFASPHPGIVVTDPQGVRHGVIGDLHLGLETSILRTSPLFSSFLSQDVIDRVRNFIEENKLRNLVVLGDVKHSIVRPPFEEKNLVRRLLEVFHEMEAAISIIRGNHDAGLQYLVKEIPEVRLSPEPWIEIPTAEGGRMLIAHGHRRLPSSASKPSTHVVLGHLHPCLRLTLEAKRPAILRVFLGFDATMGGENKSVLVLPAFNPLGCYLFSRGELKKRLAALRDFDFEDVEIRAFDLAGNFLGDLGFLRESGGLD